MPSKPPIIREWDDKPEMVRKKKIFKWDTLPANACWRCGNEGYTERTHIHAHCFNRDDSVSNLHLLCKSCHNASEGLTGWDKGHLYYVWFSTEDDSYYGCKIFAYYSKFIDDHTKVKPDDVDEYQKRFFSWFEGVRSYENEKTQTQILHEGGYY